MGGGGGGVGEEEKKEGKRGEGRNRLEEEKNDQF